MNTKQPKPTVLLTAQHYRTECRVIEPAVKFKCIELDGITLVIFRVLLNILTSFDERALPLKGYCSKLRKDYFSSKKFENVNLH